MSNLYWMAWWIGIAFGVPELLAVFWKACPWGTFSWTLWEDQRRVPILSAVVVVALALLSAHLERVRGIQEGDDVPKAPPK